MSSSIFAFFLLAPVGDDGNVIAAKIIIFFSLVNAERQRIVKSAFHTSI